MHKNVIFGRISSSMLKLASPGGDVATRGAEVWMAIAACCAARC